LVADEALALGIELMVVLPMPAAEYERDFKTPEGLARYHQLLARGRVRVLHQAHREDGEILLFGASIPPLLSASTHVVADDRRTRKLLLHKQEIDKLIGAVERKGYTIVPTAMDWKHNRVKVEIALARGKQDHDKRDAEKERDWSREKQRTMRAKNPLG
jgi:SsrA-binding protein